MKGLYYTAPSNKIFEEVKSAARKIWESYDNQFGYVDEKTEILDRMQNVEDNLMYMVAMFDDDNQKKLASTLGKKAKEAIADRMAEGGTPSEYNYFKWW